MKLEENNYLKKILINWFNPLKLGYISLEYDN
jgi:hypothetical protein